MADDRTPLWSGLWLLVACVIIVAWWVMTRTRPLSVSAMEERKAEEALGRVRPENSSPDLSKTELDSLRVPRSTLESPSIRGEDHDQRRWLICDRNGTGVEGAEVILDPSLDLPQRVFRSDPSGLVSVPAGLPRTWSVLVLASGFQPTLVAPYPELARLALREVRSARLSVRWAHTGRPVHSAVITPRIQCYGGLGEWVEEELRARMAWPAVSGRDGTASIDGLFLDTPVGHRNPTLQIDHPESARLLFRLNWLPPAPNWHIYERDIELHPTRPTILRFEFPDGRPVSERRVRIYLEEVVDWSETDARGNLVLNYAARRDDYGFWSLELDLGKGKFFYVPSLGIEDQALTIQVRHAEIHGRVAGDAQFFSELSVAAGAVTDNGGWGEPDPRSLDIRPHERSRLVWQKIARDGTFLLRDGYRGPSNGVLLRHDPSGMLLADARAWPGEESVIPSPSLTRGQIVVGRGEWRTGWRLVLRPNRRGAEEFPSYVVDGADLMVDDLPWSGTLPCSDYTIWLAIGSKDVRLGTFHFGPGSPPVELELPSVAVFSGSVRGTLSGPLSGCDVQIFSREGRRLGRTLTDESGHFATWTKDGEAATVSVRWLSQDAAIDGGHYSSSSLWTFPDTSDDGPSHCVVPEGTISVPLTGALKLPGREYLSLVISRLNPKDPMSAKGSSSRRVASFALPRHLEPRTYIVPAGTYLIQLRHKRTALFESVATILEGGSWTLPVDPSMLPLR